MLPVDQVRSRLAHAATSPTLRQLTWCEVVRRAQRLGDPCDLVAVGMTVPVLRRMLARLACPAHVERAEVEQEALAAVTSAVSTVDVDAVVVARELFATADRAVNRLVYAARRRVEQETGHEALHLGRLTRSMARTACQTVSLGAGNGEARDEYAVLARAVSAGAVGVAEALTFGGLRYLMAGGDPGEVESAKRALKAAAIGYGLAVLAPALVTVLQHIVGVGGGDGK
ncbi:pilin [Streptomyces yunnanensis]|uniref:pilin n=1 Tax=Streptomyces yunnanensis TaxID=156453 RepID=UPI002570624C|nr:pilin [Streptomyces yunnanensis]